MASTRSDIIPTHCIDDVNCGDPITAVHINKIAESIEGIYSIGTHVAELPSLFQNRNIRPAVGWNYGKVTVANSAQTYKDTTATNAIFLHRDYDRWSISMQTKLYYNVIVGVGSATLVTMSEIRISVIGFTGTQILARVMPPGTPPGTNILVGSYGVIENWEISGQFNSNLLPNADTEWAGRLVVDVFVTTAAAGGLPYYNVGVIDGAATSVDFNGLNFLNMRTYKSC